MTSDKCLLFDIIVNKHLHLINVGMMIIVYACILLYRIKKSNMKDIIMSGPQALAYTVIAWVPKVRMIYYITF